MQLDGCHDQLLARAILDMELKMKHEMRQNNALQFAKLEKHSQKIEKRLGIIEAKLEALLSRDNNNIGRMSSNNLHHFHANRQQYPAGNINRQASYYSRTANLTNSQGDKKIGRTTPLVLRAAQNYGMFGNVCVDENSGLHHLQQNNTAQHHRHFASGNGRKQQQQRPKQMVGTGSNKVKIENETWTTRLGGVYTSGEDEDSGEENESKTRTGSESCYSTIKPEPIFGEILSDKEKASNKEYSDEEEGEISDESKKRMEQKRNAKGLTDMVLEEEEIAIITAKTAISNCTFKSLEEEIDHGKKKADYEGLIGSASDNDDINQHSFNTAMEIDNQFSLNTTKQKQNVIALPFHDYDYPLMASISNENAFKIVVTKEDKKKEKMTIVATEKAQTPLITQTQTIGGFGRGRRN